MKLIDLIPDFMIELEEQLKSDEKRHGEKWKELPRTGQEQRIYERFHTYFYNFKTKGEPVPWLKIAGLALIAWTRNKYAAESVSEPVVAMPDFCPACSQDNRQEKKWYCRTCNPKPPDDVVVQEVK